MTEITDHHDNVYQNKKEQNFYGDNATAQNIMHFPENGPNGNEDKEKVMYSEPQWKNYGEPDHQGSQQN